jgi:hypothetical protein
MVARRARRIQQHIIENPTATLEQWQREREQVRRRGAHTRRSMEFVSGHFGAIGDLMMDLTLADDVNIDLGNIVRLLTAIHDLQDPTEQQSHDQEELRRLLQELNPVALQRLDNQLRRIRREVPQMEEEEGGEGQE